jgi:hypothetical protein
MTRMNGMEVHDLCSVPAFRKRSFRLKSMNVATMILASILAFMDGFAGYEALLNTSVKS